MKNNKKHFPPSVQSDLFNYLKPEQQEQLKPVLRPLKKRAQEELCFTLLDYMEQGRATPPQEVLLGALFMYLTQEGIDAKEPSDSPIIRPLRNWSC